MGRDKRGEDADRKGVQGGDRPCKEVGELKYSESSLRRYDFWFFVWDFVCENRPKFAKIVVSIQNLLNQKSIILNI